MILRMPLATGLALLATAAWAQSPFAYTCAEDSEIGEAKRKAADSVAMNFAETLLGKDPGAAFAALSGDGRQGVTPEQFRAQARAVQQLEPKNLSVQHIYLIKLLGKSAVRAVCRTDVTKPDGWVSLGAADVPEQAHVLISANARNNGLAMTVWLVPEQTGWKVQSFWMNVSTLADQGPMQLWEVARKQSQRGHKLNAALLYAAAAQVADRGPNFQLGIAQSISEDIAHMDVPAEIRGQPPFSWKSGSTTWKVLNVGPMAIGGKLYLIISHEVAPWRTEAQVDGWNKELLAYFKGRFPEYSEVFAGLIAQAHERGSNRRFGTVEELPVSK